MKLDILYDDESLIVINKSSGLLVHATSIDRNETRFALQMLRDQINQKIYPVHRLDKPTSGALIFAKSPEIAKGLCDQFASQKVKKKYLAVVRGKICENILIDYPLKEIQDRKVDVRRTLDKQAQSAQTNIRVLQSVELAVPIGRYQTARYSLIEAEPLTGRQHQIRRHLKHISHPIIGDTNYGSGVHNHFFRENLQSRRLLLACTQIEFTHPKLKSQLKIIAPLPPCFSGPLARLGLRT